MSVEQPAAAATAMPENVRAAFQGMPQPERSLLLRVRDLVLETAAATDGVGLLLETLKWGEPAYLPARSRIGTTVRLGITRGGQPAVFCHCQTNLIERFRAAYGGLFDFEGNRALVLRTGAALPRAELGHCIAMALTYHRCKT